MKLLIELDEEYVKAIDKIRFLVGGRTARKLQSEIIKAIKNGKILEQEPKSEWEQDHEILRAYSDGANEVLDKVRAEIEDLDFFYDNDYFSSNKDAMFKRNEVLAIFDKYKGESEK